MDPFSKPRNRRTNQGYNRVGAGPEYEGVPNADGSLMEYSKAPYSRGTISTLIGMTALIGAIAVTGLVIASILAGSNFIKQGSSPMFDNIKVSGTVNTTTLLSESIGFGSVDVQNLTTVNHTSTTIDTGHLNANDVWVNSVNSTTVSTETVSATSVNTTTVSSDTVNATTVSTETVMTNNVMHNVLSVTTNDTMPATHSHILLEGGAVVVTLPAFPLTEFKGKTFSVCNSDSAERKLVLPDGNYWLPNTYFTQILFNEGQCCATFSVTDENHVHLVGDQDNRCFSFCTSDGLFCVDPQRPGQTNAFSGMWAKGSAGTPYVTLGLNNGAGTVIEFETAGPYPPPPFHLNTRIYCGTGVDDVAECTDPDIEMPDQSAAVPVGDDARTPRLPMVYTNEFTLDGGDVAFGGLISAFGGNGTFVLEMQENEQTIISEEDNTAWNGGVFSVFKWEKLNHRPTIRHYGPSEVTNNVNVNDIAFQLRSILRLRHGIEGYAGNTGEVEGFIGLAASRDLMETLISDGISRDTELFSIQNTKHGVNPATGAESLTTIRAVAPHGITPFSTVSFSGFQDTWSVLNTGTYKVALTGLTNYQTETANLYTDYHADPAQSTVKFTFNIVFDSAGFPDEFNGTAVVHVSHGPATPAMEYREFMDAAYYWSSETTKQSLHNNFRQYYNPAATGAPFFVHNTFEEFQNTISTTVPTGVSSGRFLTGFRLREQASIFYLNPTTQSGSSFTFVAREYLPVNDPFLVDALNDFPNPGGVYNKFIMRNYLEEEWVPYWKQVGAPDPSNPLQVLSSFFNSPGDGSVGRSFDGVVYPFDAIAPVGENYLSINTPQNCIPGSPLPFSCGAGGGPYTGFPGFVNDQFKETFFFGLVNRNFTDGRNIGYVRIADTVQFEPLVAMYSYDMRPEDAEDSPRYHRESLARILAPMMRKIVTEWECDRVILDIRGNGGGLIAISKVMAEFFGDDQDVLGARIIAPNFDDFTNPIDGTTLDPARTLKKNQDKIAQNTRLFKDYNEAVNPGTRITDGYVAILTDVSSASGGDLFPNHFVGENEDNQMGVGVQSFLFGEVDGRTMGAGSGNLPLPVSGLSPRLKALDTYPFPSVLVRCENGIGGFIHPSNRTTFTRSPGLACSPGTSVTGLAGGNCFPNTYEHTVHYDLGFVTPHPDPRLPNDNRIDPIPTDADTWRGRWEEDVIRTLSALPLPVKKKQIAVPVKAKHAYSVKRVPGMACDSSVQARNVSHTHPAFDVNFDLDNSEWADAEEFLALNRGSAARLLQWTASELSHNGFCQNQETGHIEMVDSKIAMMPNVAVKHRHFQKK